MMTQEEMNLLVPQKLKEIEASHGVKALYSAESGSRAWGFASPDSDFDVRFIYIRPRNDYLRLNEIRDVIEMPIDDTWDVSGWDLQKALRLLWKSNPTIYEWMQSRIRYLDSDFDRRMAPLLREYFSKKSMMYHYYHMAGNNMRTFLKDKEAVKPKKYFYALRPILACRWILENNSAPPILYSDLVDAQLPASLRNVNEELLDMKKSLPEGAEIKPLKAVDDFLNDQAEALGNALRGMPDYKPKSWDALNQFFLSELDRMEGTR